MKIAVPNESAGGERRVALVPDVIKRLSGKGHEVVVEAGAGEGARIPDALFEDAGAAIGSLEGADVVVRVTPPSSEDVERLPDGSVLIGFLAPLTSPETTRALASAGVTAFAMEAIPRISRAQSMDALSSQASVGGYRAALIGAQELGRFFPMLTTAAGPIPPSKVLVLGAGVAGLQAIATARRLGAQVTAFDVRSVVKEQVESLGAKFLELDIGADAEAEGGYARELTPEEQQRQQEALNDAMRGVDLEITPPVISARHSTELATHSGVDYKKTRPAIRDLARESSRHSDLTQT